jgi:Domain of unknown function (DUF4129)
MTRSSSQPGVFTRGLRLIEDAVDLLRGLSTSTWLIFASGVVPFFVLLLHALNDVSRDPFAGDSLLTLSLLLAVAYLWMHYCQARFAQQLAALATGGTEAATHDSVAADASHGGFRLFCAQAVLQGVKIIVWPIGLGLLIPHGITTLFFQHATATTSETAWDWRSSAREAWADATYHQGEGVWFLIHVLLLRIVVCFNVLALAFVAVALFHIFTGVNNDLTRAPANLLNPATIEACLIASYIALDPIVKGACVLRSLERRSSSTGFDLHLRLKRVAPELKNNATRAAALLVFAVLFVAAVQARATETARPQSAASVSKTPVSNVPGRAPAIVPSAARIEKAVDSVFHDRTLTWDLPVVVKKKKPANAFLSFTDSVVEKLRQWRHEFGDWLDDIMARLRRMASGNGNGSDREETRMASSQEVWLLLAGLCGLLGAGVFFAAMRSRRLRAAEIVAAIAVAPPAPDLTREDVQADEQPASTWAELAAEYRRRGDFRLALRALYLSCLATLASAKLISIARGKSNLDYVREFQRRAKRLSAELPPTLRNNVRLFEQSWYGEHPVDDEILDEFERNLAMLRSKATKLGAAL